MGERVGEAGFGGCLVSPAALRRVTTLLEGVSLGLVGPMADRPVVGRFLSPLGYDCWVDECLEERQRVQLPKEDRAYATARRQD